jgi:hypothetical protein
LVIVFIEEVRNAYLLETDAMYRSSIRNMVFISFISLTGCCPNGCFVLSGDAYRALAFPEPMRKRWARDATTDEQRQADWFECGGADTGNFVPQLSLIEQVQHEKGIDYSEARERIFNDLQRCMLRKGYRYTARCDLEVFRAMPACGAP